MILAVSSVDNALTILQWNNRTKIKLACPPGASMWETDHLRRYTYGLAAVQAIHDEHDKELVVQCAIEMSSPGRVEELAVSNKLMRSHLVEWSKVAWHDGISRLSEEDVASSYIDAVYH